MRRLALIFVFLPIFIGQSYAKPKAQSPHEGEMAEPGVIVGALYKGKAPLPGHAVRLEILRGSELVLTINKVTDEKGAYRFKNIFQSPDFSYAVSAEYEGKSYRTQFTSLKEGQGTLKLNLKVGEGSPEGPPLPEARAPDSGQLGHDGKPDSEHIHKEPSGEYKLLAVVLSLVAIALALKQRKRA